MGNCLQGTFIRSNVESFLDLLQDKGLENFREISFGGWSPKTVYGYDFSRNDSFRRMLDLLSGQYKKGITLADQSVGEMTAIMENYIAMQLVNQVMKVLLNNGESVIINLDEITKDSLNLFYELPKYKHEDIKKFKDSWTRCSMDQHISLQSKDKCDHEVLSAKLAALIELAINHIDMPTIISQSITKFNAIKAAETQRRLGLFQAAGGNAQTAQTMLRGREEYTRDQQERDLRGVIRADLTNAAGR